MNYGDYNCYHWVGDSVIYISVYSDSKRDFIFLFFPLTSVLIIIIFSIFSC